MSMRAMPLLCAALLIALSSGCATWVKRSDAFPSERPAPALLAALSVEVEQKEGSSLNVLDLAQNASLKPFGDSAYPMLQEALREEGLELFLEKERAQAFEQFWAQKDNRMTTFTGQWQHPETASVSLQQFRSLFHAGSHDSADKVKAVSADNPQDLYTFASMTVLESVGFGCGGITLWGAPKVALDLIVIDGDGRKIYDARVIGEGHGTPFVIDRSHKNLRVALKDALTKLAALEEKPLE